MSRIIALGLACGLAALFVLSLGLWGRYGATIAWDTFLAYCL